MPDFTPARTLARDLVSHATRTGCCTQKIAGHHLVVSLEADGEHYHAHVNVITDTSRETRTGVTHWITNKIKRARQSLKA